MAKRTTTAKKKIIRTIACKHLVQLNEISNAGNPLCHCDERGFTISPFNMICQVCAIYNPNSQGITHDQLYIAEGAEVEINWDEIAIGTDDEVDDDDFDSEADEFEDELLIDKVKFVVEDDEEEEEEEEEVEEEDEEDGLIIGQAKKEKKEEVPDYEDEREEDLGKKAGTPAIDEDDELEEELEELEEELGYEGDDSDNDPDDESSAKKPSKSTRSKKKKPSPKSTSTPPVSDSGIDFEKDVLSKVKTVQKNGEDHQVCPYCSKPYKVVTRHIYRCKRAPAGIAASYAEYKKTH